MFRQALKGICVVQRTVRDCKGNENAAKRIRGFFKPEGKSGCFGVTSDWATWVHIGNFIHNLIRW